MIALHLFLSFFLFFFFNPEENKGWLSQRNNIDLLSTQMSK